MRADLHVHTTASDGCWTVEETVSQVQEVGIQLLAVADHDTVVNVPRAADLARRAGLSYLTGVEVSARLDERILHVLGYGIDPYSRALREALKENYTRLDDFNTRTLERLAQAGHAIDLDEYDSYHHEPSRGGWKGLNYLIDQGVCRDVEDFFRHLFVGSIRPPTPDFPSVPEVVSLIRAADGVPILAHPGYSLDLSPDDGRAGARRLTAMVEFGVAGLECYSSYHDPAVTQMCLDFCKRQGMLITGGSDCHGGFAGRTLGVPEVHASDLQLGELEGRIS